jgi:hypothetical protein
MQGMTQQVPSPETLIGFANALCVWGKRMRLSCGTCYEATSCDMPRGYIPFDPEQHQQAARMFFDKGWRWTDRPICPVCIRRNAAPLGQKKKVTKQIPSPDPPTEVRLSRPQIGKR